MQKEGNEGIMKKVLLNGSIIRVKLSNSIISNKFPKRLKCGSFKIPKNLQRIAQKISI